MRLPDLGRTALQKLPRWPPVLATRGPGGATSMHAHHAMHLMIAVAGTLRVKAADDARWQRAAGVVTAPDVAHAIDAAGLEVAIVFLDPESDVGASIAGTIGGALRLVTAAERDRLARDAEPAAIMREGGEAWTRRAVDVLGSRAVPERPRLHPRVRRLLRLLADAPPADDSLEALARAVGLSPGRLMHVFTESIGIPLRPYLAWLRLQRAAAAIVGGAPLSNAAHAAGFADAAHMTRTFRKMFGITPGVLAPRRAGRA